MPQTRTSATTSQGWTQLMSLHFCTICQMISFFICLLENWSFVCIYLREFSITIWFLPWNWIDIVFVFINFTLSVFSWCCSRNAWGYIFFWIWKKGPKGIFCSNCPKSGTNGPISERVPPPPRVGLVHSKFAFDCRFLPLKSFTGFRVPVRVSISRWPGQGPKTRLAPVSAHWSAKKKWKKKPVQPKNPSFY